MLTGPVQNKSMTIRTDNVKIYLSILLISFMLFGAASLSLVKATLPPVVPSGRYDLDRKHVFLQS
jgi:hypothetical protein